MSLRPLLRHLEHHPDAPRLEEPGARAFVSQSLRPFLIAAVADRDVRRPTVVVAGGDRPARWPPPGDPGGGPPPPPVPFFPRRGRPLGVPPPPPPPSGGPRGGCPRQRPR